MKLVERYIGNVKPRNYLDSQVTPQNGRGELEFITAISVETRPLSEEC